jgi:hypothetical protein
MKQAERRQATLMMEAICSFKMLVDFHWTAQHYSPEDRTLQINLLFIKLNYVMTYFT